MNVSNTAILKSRVRNYFQNSRLKKMNDLYTVQCNLILNLASFFIACLLNKAKLDYLLFKCSFDFENQKRSHNI